MPPNSILTTEASSSKEPKSRQTSAVSWEPAAELASLAAAGRRLVVQGADRAEQGIGQRLLLARGKTAGDPPPEDPPLGAAHGR